MAVIRVYVARPMRRLVLSLSLVLCACPKEEDPPPRPDPPHFLWSADAQSLDNPFPDERLIVDGVARFRPRWYRPFLPASAVTTKSGTFFNEMARQASLYVHAFGNFGGTLIPASEALDETTVHGRVARLVKEDAGWRVLEADVQVEHPREALARRSVAWPDGWPEFISTRPTVPLPEKHEGLLVVLRGVKTKGGVELGQSHAFKQANTIDEGALAALGVTAADVIYFLPQRAGDVSSTPRALARWADANPVTVTVPAQGMTSGAPVGLWRSTDPDWHQLMPWLDTGWRAPHDVGAVIVGELAARDLRQSLHFKAEWVADPSLAPVVPLKFVAAFPRGPKPAGGWPVVISQHGVSGRNTLRAGSYDSFCLQWAEELALRGMGCIGIDAPDHGTRGVFTNFFSIGDPGAIADRMRQMTFDLLQLERAAVTLDVDGDGTPDVAPQLRYFGNSMGAIMGSGFIPFSNRVSSAMLNVPGAGLSNVVMSRFLNELIGFLIIAETGFEFESPEYFVAFPLFRAMAQPFFDPGDPINLAPAVPDGVAVLQQAGLRDEVVPNDSSVDLSRALGLPAAVNASGPGPKRGFILVDPAAWLPASAAATYNGHNVIWDFEPIRRQALIFLESDGRELFVP